MTHTQNEVGVVVEWEPNRVVTMVMHCYVPSRLINVTLFSVVVVVVSSLSLSHTLYFWSPGTPPSLGAAETCGEWDSRRHRLGGPGWLQENLYEVINDIQPSTHTHTALGLSYIYDHRVASLSTFYRRNISLSFFFMIVASAPIFGLVRCMQPPRKCQVSRPCSVPLYRSIEGILNAHPSRPPLIAYSLRTLWALRPSPLPARRRSWWRRSTNSLHASISCPMWVSLSGRQAGVAEF